MAKPWSVLLESNLRNWFGTRGFALVVGAALVPLILTGAWVLTHQRDVKVEVVTGTQTTFVDGDRVNFTATVANVGRGDTGAFNLTIHILRYNELSGTLTDSSFEGGAVNTSRIEGLGKGATATGNLAWTARPGLYWVIAQADMPGDEVGEIDELNNFREFNDVTSKPDLFIVPARLPNASAAPRAPVNITGSPNATANVDLAVTGLTVPGTTLTSGENVTFQATVANRGTTTVTNATLVLRLGSTFNNQLTPIGFEHRLDNETLAPGEERRLQVNWTAFNGAYWAQAYADVGMDQRDATEDNHEAKAFRSVPRPRDDLLDAVDQVFGPYLTPPPKATIKVFYLDLLSFLHLRFLLPLIGLFYAAGVLADDRERGNLAYILTRPVNRATLPVTKFGSSFVVASTAVIVGIVATFFLLLGTPQGNLGYLTTPLIISLITLFVYGSFFTLLGVVVNRPYLIGLAFIGWEFVVLIGSTDLVINGRPVVAPWVQNLTLIKWLATAISNWPLDKGLQWLPGPAGLEALRNVLLAAVVFLAAAVYIVKRREYDV